MDTHMLKNWMEKKKKRHKMTLVKKRPKPVYQCKL